MSDLWDYETDVSRSLFQAPQEKFSYSSRLLRLGVVAWLLHMVNNSQQTAV